MGNGEKEKKNGITALLNHYERDTSSEWASDNKLEELNLIERYFSPLRAEINQGRYDFNLIKAMYSAVNLLDLKIQLLLDMALQRESSRQPQSIDSKEELLSTSLNLARPICALERPITPDTLLKAYIELCIHRKKKRTYDIKPETMDYAPIEIEFISIEEDKEKLLEKLQQFKKASIELSSLLEKRSWQEVVNVLNILLHLAHEGKIKLHQKEFPKGKIMITYTGGQN